MAPDSYFKVMQANSNIFATSINEDHDESDDGRGHATNIHDISNANLSDHKPIDKYKQHVTVVVI